MQFYKTKFKNDWYPVILIIYVIANITTQLAFVSTNFELTNYINLIIVSCVIASVLFDFYPHIIVRVAGLVIFLFGCIGLLSDLVSILFGNLDVTYIGKALKHFLNISIGFILYFYYESSVVDSEQE